MSICISDFNKITLFSFVQSQGMQIFVKGEEKKKKNARPGCTP